MSRTFLATHQPQKGPLSAVCSLATVIATLSCAGAETHADTPDTEQSPTPSSECGELEECEKACKAQEANACEWLGQLHETGDGVPQDYTLASKYYEQACEHGSATACGHLAMMYDIGLAVHEDPQRAAQLYGIACESGSRWACTRQAQLAEDAK